MDEKVYDLVIVGSGPAGLAAAIYAVRAELNAVVLDKTGMSGGQIINTYEVDNYPGMPGMSGFELAMKMREHCDKLGIQQETGEVIAIQLDGKIKTLCLEDGRKLHAKTVIIATGARYRKLHVPGEEELLGSGVSYCATCDGAFFKNKTAVVVGGGDVAVEDAIFLSRICKKVYVVHRRDEFRAAKTLTSKLLAAENVEILWNSTLEEILGNKRVEQVRIREGKEQKENQLEADGVFVAVGTIPNTKEYESTLKLDESGYICADETCATNVEGVFAAGDVRTKTLRQVITAAADGAVAITGVERYLNQY